jgi:uncharacterized membrane protein
LPRPTRSATTAALAVYTLLSGATTLVREPLHDEGVTWDQVFGPMPVEADGATVSALWPRHPLSPSEVVDGLIERGLHPPAYFLFLSLWTKFTGANLFLLRLPGLLFGGLAVIGLGRLAGLLAGDDAARSAVLIAAASPWLAYISAFARPYALAVALSVWTSCLLVAARGVPARGGWLYLALSAIGLYSVYQYVLVVAAQAVCWTLGASLPSRSRIRALVIGATLLAIAYAPWISEMRHHLQVSTGPFYFSGTLTISQWSRGAVGLLRRLLFPNVPGAAAWALTAAVGILAAGYSATRPARLRQAAVALAYACVLASVSLCADVVRGSHTLLFPHTAFGLFPSVVLLLAVLTAAAPGRRLVPLLFAASLAVTLVLQWLNPSSLWRAAKLAGDRDGRNHVIVAGPALRGAVYPFVWDLRRAGASDARLVLRGDDPAGGGAADSPDVTVVRLTRPPRSAAMPTGVVVEGWPPPFIE